MLHRRGWDRAGAGTVLVPVVRERSLGRAGLAGAPSGLVPAFWFLMQVGMMVGYATSWPANVWLVNRGIKIPM